MRRRRGGLPWRGWLTGASAGTGARRSTGRGVVLAAGDGAHGGPDHVALIRVEAEAVGGPRGCRKRPKISTTVMRSPQRGHGASQSGGCAASGGGPGGQQVADAGEIGAAGDAGEQAVVADAVEALGQDVQEEAPDELVRGQRQGAVALRPVAAIVLDAEGDGGRVEADEPPVR